MILPQRISRLVDNKIAALTVSANTLAQQTQTVSIPRTWPLEEIIVIVTVVLNSTAITDQINHGLLGVLRKVTLGTNNGIKPETPVSVTGPGLIQLVANEGLSLDRSTLSSLYQQNQTFLPGSGVYQIAYRIPLVHPMITGALRPRMLLPVHVHNEDPVLSLEFAAGTECITTAASWVSVTPEVWLIRREMPAEFAAFIAKNSPDGDPRRWFIPSDIVESQNALAAGQTDQELRINVPTPGQYSSLLLYTMAGSASGAYIRSDISASATVGSETEWKIESGGIGSRNWRMKVQQLINDWSRPTFPASMFNLNVITLNAAKTASTAAVNTTANSSVASPQFGGALSTGYGIQNPNSIFHDFLSDGINDAEELGSLLDCNLPARQGLKMEIVSRVTTPATFPSQANIVGRRFYGDLSRWQTTEKLG